MHVNRYLPTATSATQPKTCLINANEADGKHLQRTRYASKQFYNKFQMSGLNNTGNKPQLNITRY